MFYKVRQQADINGAQQLPDHLASMLVVRLSSPRQRMQDPIQRLDASEAEKTDATLRRAGLTKQLTSSLQFANVLHGHPCHNLLAYLMYVSARLLSVYQIWRQDFSQASRQHCCHRFCLNFTLARSIRAPSQRTQFPHQPVFFLLQAFG